MFDSIHSALENKLQTYVIYLDFKRAFDNVPHNELLLKLAEMGYNWEPLEVVQNLS